jgi:O-antigen/teichoic acid export membrane protein
MKTKSKLLSSSLELGVLGIGRVLQIVTQVISVRISTTILSPSQFGSISQMMSLSGVFVQVLHSPVSIYIMRAFRDWRESGTLLKNLIRYLKYIIIIALFSMMFAGLIQWSFNIVNGINITWVVVLVGIYVLFSPIYSIGTTGLNLLYRRVEFVLFSNLSSWMGMGLAITLILIFSNQVYWILGSFLGTAIASTSFFYLTRYLRSLKEEKVVDSDNQKTIPFNIFSVFPFAWPQLVTSVLWIVQSQSYRFILDKISVIADVGLYSAGYALAATPMILFENLFTQFYDPIYYNNLKGKDRDGQAKVWNDYASAYVPAILLVGAFVGSSGYFLIKVFLATRFQTVTSFFFWLAITETLRGVSGIIHYLGIAKIDMRILILPVASGAILAVIGVILLGRWNALQGTGIALCIAMLSSLIIGIYIGFRALPVTLSIRRILLSCLLSLPMIIGFQISKLAIPNPSVWLAVVVLGTGTVYLFISEYFLAKEWLNRSTS